MCNNILKNENSFNLGGVWFLNDLIWHKNIISAASTLPPLQRKHRKYRYFHHICTDQIMSIIPPLLVLARRTRTSTLSQPVALHPENIRNIQFGRAFFPRSYRLWGCLLTHLFSFPLYLISHKSHVNRIPLPQFLLLSYTSRFIHP